ncbi:Holliday junction resolvase RecU [Sporosarcina sp. ANT_H38]|uniref:Holliday junction resolvase RecU n=1 Tax=Sporosarcina sp. ANT_H38 TaxID=2597358 RepID=UPI0011F178B5|nr:Holliday junction resolvase RecU [Sporosarcina sp. ANT_H38]KAA0944099.1 Holliday junction resolvase RecU [Sporosarcina sp. ANT_H38]
MRKPYSRSHANRGAVLERLIDMTNQQYRNKGIADIRKIPTPVQIQSNVRGKITGYITKGEWVDYSGVWNGKAVVFDVKETSSKTSFPLDNISEHQFQLLKSWREKGAWAFLLVSFTKHDEVYLLPVGLLERYWEDARNGGRKSIPHKDFMMDCELIQSEKGYVLHYLK